MCALGVDTSGAMLAGAMDREFAGYLLTDHAFSDAVSAIWRARSVADRSRLATLRIFDVPEDGQLAGSMFAFRQAAEAAAAIVHPHVLGTRDVGRRGNHTFVASAPTTAVPLGSYLRGALTLRRALRLLGPLAGALDAATHQDMAHGALHPRSIWVDPVGEGHALITGFGLHHLVRVLAVQRRDGEALDDFRYIAPELLRGGRPTGRSDQFALAAAIVHAVSGHPPFAGAHLSDLLRAHLFDRPAVDGADVTGLDEVLARALAKNPDDRYDSSAALVAALDGLPAARPAGDVAPPGPPRAATSAAPARAPGRTGESPSGRAEGAPSGGAGGSRPRRSRHGGVLSHPWILAAVGVLIGVVVALVTFSRFSSSAQDGELVAAANLPQPVPTEADSVPPGVRWRHALPAAASDLLVTPAGVVAVAPQQAVVVDPESGRVRTELDGPQTGAALTGDDALVMSGGDVVQARGIAGGEVRWRSDVSDPGSPVVLGETAYIVSGEQLAALDTTSGRRRWTLSSGGDGRAVPVGASVAPVDGFVYAAGTDALLGVLPAGASVGRDSAAIAAGETADAPLIVWRATSRRELWPSSLRGVDGGVVIADRAGRVCLRRKADGRRVWCVPVRGVADAEPLVFANGGEVLVVTAAAATALDLGTGEQEWTRAGEWRGAALAGADDLVVVDATGAIAMLTTDSGSPRTVSDATIATPALLAVAGGELYAATADGDVVAVDMTGG